MGYKYGIWYVYPRDTFQTTHIGHFTITCFMDEPDAKELYTELITRIGPTNEIHIHCKNPIKFKKNMYKDDENDICSWGYTASVSNWDVLQNIAEKYKCNFSTLPHTSIQYCRNDSDLKLVSIDANVVVKAEIKLINICNDEPNDWFIIA